MMGFWKFMALFLFAGFVCFGIPFTIVVSQVQEVGRLEKELKNVSYELRVEKDVAQNFSGQIDSLRKIIKDNILTSSLLASVTAEASGSEWKTVKVLAYENYCLATIDYKINKFDKEKKEYDVLLRDADMAKKDTHIRAFGCWVTGSVIHSDVYIAREIVTGLTFKALSDGDMFKLLSNPHINGFQNPTAVALTDILEAIVQQESH